MDATVCVAAQKVILKGFDGGRGICANGMSASARARTQVSNFLLNQTRNYQEMPCTRSVMRPQRIEWSAYAAGHARRQQENRSIVGESTRDRLRGLIWMRRLNAV